MLGRTLLCTREGGDAWVKKCEVTSFLNNSIQLYID